MNPDIESTPLEMIPMALAIYDEGKLDEWIEKIKSARSSHCLAFVHDLDEGKGKCGRYQERPSLCRMFGVAGYLNKNEEVVLSICRVIKDHFGEEAIPRNLQEDSTPVMAKWTMLLASLDPRLIQERLPINEALLRALEKVALYMSFEEENPRR